MIHYRWMKWRTSGMLRRRGGSQPRGRPYRGARIAANTPRGPRRRCKDRWTEVRALARWAMSGGPQEQACIWRVLAG